MTAVQASQDQPNPLHGDSRVRENDVTKRFGVELRKATRQLVNDIVPAPMLTCLAELQAAERSHDRTVQDASTRQLQTR